MKKILFILLGVLILSCQQKGQKESGTSESETKPEMKNENNNAFNWLTGRWKRMPPNKETETFEIWSRESNTRFLGHGFVMKGTDTLWQENMVLSKRDSVWVLEVSTPGNNDLVRFGLTAHTPASFTVENPEHDFPKKIRYWKDDDYLKASVSGDEKELLYEFERIK